MTLSTKILSDNLYPRIESINIELGEEASTSISPWANLFSNSKARLRIPLCSPEVYKPLVLIAIIGGVQLFSGFTFTKKFLLQVLQPSFNLTQGSEIHNESSSPDHTIYYFAM